MKPNDPRFLGTIYDVRSLFSSKWALAITVVLMDGSLYYTDILERVRKLDVSVDWSDRHNVLHESVLTRTLKRMAAEGLLVREEGPTAFPPSVHYSISGETRTALEAMAQLADWGAANCHMIEQAKLDRMRSMNR